MDDSMYIRVLQGILIPFLGTTLGSACVLFMKNKLNPLVQRALTGFAAGVMVAASIWSLLIPAMEYSETMGTWSFIPAVTGFWLGILFLLVLDRTVPHLHMNSSKAEGPKSNLQKTTMLVLAVTLHNLPGGYPGMPVLLQWALWPFRWELPYKISRKEPLFPCPCGQRAWAREGRFYMEYFPAWWSRWVRR